ncbi:MAG: hypothetical protein LC745_05025, partial [Planctomycetia bacterium]|nr:hypothetical protein [Planctomycetia bacterium]
MRPTNPGPRPRPRGVFFPALAVAAAALTLASPESAPAQATKKAATPIDNRPLARYIPRDNLILFAGTEGLDLQAEAWQKTAAYKMLNETSLGVMLEDMTAQLADHALMTFPNRKLNGADVVAMVKHMAKAGFAIGINTPEKTAGGGDLLTLVVRGGAGKNARGPFARLLGTMMGANKTTKLMKAGRNIVVVGDPAKGQSAFAWWAEQNDDLVVVLGEGAENAVTAIADGKTHNAVENAVRTELARAEGGFLPVFQLFFDTAGSPSAPRSPWTSAFFLDLSTFTKKYLGTRLDYRWGFQDDALMSVLRVKSPRPRRNLLVLLDQPSFDKTKLPPLPEGIESFTIVSFEADKLYELLLSISPTPEARARLTAPADAFKAKTRIDLRKDLLARLGSRFAFYVMPGGPAHAAAPAAGAGAVAAAAAGVVPLPAAGNPLGSLFGAA